MTGQSTWWPTELPDSYAPTHGWPLTYVACLAAIALTLAYLLLNRTMIRDRLSAVRIRWIDRAISSGLVVSALLAILTYHDFGLFRYDTYYNEWSLFHYYLGTKYAPEVGYTDMYGAALMADAETGLKYDAPTFRDLKTYERIKTVDALADPARYKTHFDRTRWEEFKADVSWFKDQFPAHRWRLILDDHGYNGTPAWTFLAGGLLTRHLSIRSSFGRFVMLSLDPLLWILSIGCVLYAFGFRAALLLIVFVGTHYLMSWGHLKGALLRTDFALCTLMAVCLVKRERYALAGVLLGWATLSRVFPLFFLVGPSIRLITVFIEQRRIDRDLIRLFLSFTLTLSFFFLGSLFYGGIDLWTAWVHKITHHYVTGSHWNIGFQPIMDVMSADGIPTLINPLVHFAEEPGMLRLHYGITWGIRAVLLIPALYFIRWLEDADAICFGYVFLFFLMAPTYYYYLILVVPFVFFAARIEQVPYAVGTMYMLVVGIAGHLLFTGANICRELLVFCRGFKQYFQTYYYISWLLMGAALYMLILAARVAVRGSAGYREISMKDQ